MTDLCVNYNVEEYARLQYSPEQIADSLGLNSSARSRFLLEIRTPDTKLNQAYMSAYLDGEKTIDDKLAQEAEQGDVDCAKELRSRQDNRHLAELKYKLFGV